MPRPIPAVLRTVALATGLATLAGCVPQAKYDDLLTSYRSKEQQVLTLQSDLDESRTNEQELRRKLAEAAADLEAMRASLGGEGGDLDAMRARYEELLKKINDLESPLPREIEIALGDIANDYPEIFEFDAAKGMLRFKSDVTFDSGSAQLTSRANEVLAKIAPVLNSSAASNLEIKVVGHTDNVPISRPATRQQHPSNMYLSAHRAISVRDQLVRDGVSAPRFQVAGYGEYRPIAANASGGSRENRRVELYLSPLTTSVAGTFGKDLPSGTPALGGASGGAKIVPAATASVTDEPTK
jgi:chemotaxis protein MotB